MMVFRPADERGQADFGWLNSAHTFSFGEYYDPQHMGFSALRVINDDRVAPAAGFATHGHRNMEIISLVLSGQIAHRDSAGNQRVLPSGEFQLMSAGSGIRHSEFNASTAEPLHFLQIWIQPDELNTEPGYQQAAFERQAAVQPVITADGRDGTLSIRQDAVVSHVRLLEDAEVVDMSADRAYYLHVIDGPLLLNGQGDDVTEQYLQAGDGVAITAEAGIVLSGNGAQALLFDLPGIR